MTGLPALLSFVIFWIAIRHRCLWLKVTGHDLTIADMRHIETVPFDTIADVATEAKPHPRWLSPLLILFGGWRGLSIALLTGERPSHSLVLHLKDGTQRRVPSDAFPDQRKIVAALQHGGVHLDPSLRALAGKPATRRHRTKSTSATKKDNGGKAHRA